MLPRPTYRLTTAEATACRRAINLGRSFLGAPGTLGARRGVVKQSRNANTALCEFFFTTCTHLRRAPCALHTKRDQGFAEPGALSSTFPADLPLPRTASRESFVLLASRARRSGNLLLSFRPLQGDPSRERPQIANDRSADDRQARRRVGCRHGNRARDRAAARARGRVGHAPGAREGAARGDGRVDRGDGARRGVRHPAAPARRPRDGARRRGARADPRARRGERRRRPERGRRRGRRPVRRHRADEPQRDVLLRPRPCSGTLLPARTRATSW